MTLMKFPKQLETRREIFACSCYCEPEMFREHVVMLIRYLTMIFLINSDYLSVKSIARFCLKFFEVKG